MTESRNWAILRQLVLASDDALAEAARIAEQLRLPAGFADPMLAGIGLADAAMPVGPVQFLEVVGPLDETSYINRWLGKVGGAGGYCLSVQVPDAPACKERALALGVRLAADEVLDGAPAVPNAPGRRRHPARTRRRHRPRDLVLGRRDAGSEPRCADRLDRRGDGRRARPGRDGGAVGPHHRARTGRADGARLRRLPDRLRRAPGRPGAGGAVPARARGRRAADRASCSAFGSASARRDPVEAVGS